MSRAQRERRTPLPPDQAVRPLVERGLASTTVRPRAIRGRGRGGAPGQIPIVIDSDTGSDEETSSQIIEDNEMNVPAHTRKRVRNFVKQGHLHHFRIITRLDCAWDKRA
jgi:hypothetical protein